MEARRLRRHGAAARKWIVKPFVLVLDTKTVGGILRSRDTAPYATGLNPNRLFATLNPRIFKQNGNTHLKKPAYASVDQTVP